ncbi:MAG: CDP-archaeol synthase [Gemmatimonadetes bacterium]|nr:CDP-archaeol synthase [Gemmatimonadota bacterium]
MAGELTRRVAVSVVGIPLALLVAYLGSWVLGALLAALAALSAMELFRLAELRGTRPFTALGVAGAVFFVVVAAGSRSVAAAAAWLWGGTVVLLVAGATLAIWLRGGASAPLASVTVTAGGAVYAGGLLSFAIFLRHLPESSGSSSSAATAWQGTALLGLPLLVTWLGDTVAYFAGRRWGRKKLIPAVSPGKTWVGALAGLAAAVLAAAAYGSLVLDGLPTHRMGARSAALAGLVIGVAAQMGDLVESLFKREAGVKDSGRILPGHGGMLDRLDALFFSLPVAYWFVVAWEAVR